jgi:hypothetical protein
MASPWLELPATAIADPPILVRYPVFPFLGMSATGPGQQHGKEHATEFPEGPYTGVDGEVITPAYDLGRQKCDQQFLVDTSILVQGLMKLLYMSSYGRLAGLDDGFDAESFPIAGSGTPGSSDLVLPDIESQKVETWLMGPLIQGMDHPGFTRLRFQSHLLEPPRGEPLAFFDDRFVFVEDDESSSAGEFHPRALTELDVRLSPHPAPTL